jgi:ATP-binding cassette subfamily B protein
MSLIPTAPIKLESDLDSQGRMGSSLLVADGNSLRVTETTPLGEILVSDFDIDQLSDLEILELVDATAITARIGEDRVELIRTTNRKSIELAAIEHQLKALVAGNPIPPNDTLSRFCPKCARPLPENSNVCEGCISRGKTLIRLFGYTKAHKSRLIWGSILSVGGMLLELAPPFLTGLLIDEALERQNAPFFLRLILFFLVARFLIMVVAVARGRNVAYLGSKISVEIRHSLFVKLQELSLGFYDRRNVGSLMSRMTNDTSAIYDVLVDGIPVILNQLILLIAIPIALFRMNWYIALFAVLPIPFVLFVVRIFRRKMHRVWSRVWHQWSRMGATLNGILQGTRVVKALRGESREVDRFNRRISELAHSGYLAELGWSNLFPFVVFVMSISVVLVWYAGGREVLDGGMKVGTLVAFVGYVQRLNDPLMQLQRIIDWSTRALTAAERVFEVLDTPIDIQDSPDAVSLNSAKGELVLENVHFGYDRLRTVLHGIDLHIRPGEMIGVVGHSGSGKTTLINIILRFYDPVQGRITLDGHDLKKIRLADFREHVGVVLQESYLFPGSIRDNIAYGRPNATLEDIIRAAKAANAHDFICKFPDGYDSYVGERGQRLSGGERQRISIARAILHNPKVLILDEATASVDTETERMIQEAIENLVEGRTVIAIAHRLSTLRSADRLVVMEDGKIAEIGTHSELLENENGIYTKLVKMQSEIGKMNENMFGHTVNDEEAELN